MPDTGSLGGTPALRARRYQGGRRKGGNQKNKPMRDTSPENNHTMPMRPLPNFGSHGARGGQTGCGQAPHKQAAVKQGQGRATQSTRSAVADHEPWRGLRVESPPPPHRQEAHRNEAQRGSNCSWGDGLEWIEGFSDQLNRPFNFDASRQRSPTRRTTRRGRVTDEVLGRVAFRRLRTGRRRPSRSARRRRSS